MYDVYVLKDGDTIEEISNRYNTTKEFIYWLNQLEDNSVLEVGMEIVVPKGNNNSNSFYYTVKSGDTIYSIAKEFEVDSSLLLDMNGLEKDDYIYPNQTLLVPGKGFFVYMTKDGDTLNQLADLYQKDLNELLQVNENIYLMPNQIIFFKKK